MNKWSVILETLLIVVSNLSTLSKLNLGTLVHVASRNEINNVPFLHSLFLYKSQIYCTCAIVLHRH